MTSSFLDFDPEKYLRLKNSLPLFDGKELPLAEIVDLVKEGKKPVMVMRRFKLNQETLETEEINSREYELDINILKEEKARLEDTLQALNQIIFEVESL